jgi:replication fork clamp-binding protein CrfC
MTMAKSETIKIQVGEEVIELTGADKEAFLADREASLEAQRLLEAEAQAKQAKLDSAKAKLAALGLDEEEIAAIVGGI